MQSTTRIFTFALLTLTACGPCESSIVADTFASPVVCPDSMSASGESEDSSTEGSGSSTDGASSTGMTPTASTSDSESGDACVVNPGGDWGPCVDNKCPNAVGTAFCIQLAAGSVCMPACKNAACPDFGCDGGQCMDSGACAPPCAVDVDCPFGGMICDSDLPSFGVCVWPK